MNTLEKFFGSISQAFEFNEATLSGCMDIIVIQQPDGSLKSTPFHARFGKFKVFKSKDKIVKIHVNNCEASFSMKLGPAGEAFFEEDAHESVYMGRPSQSFIQDPIILPDSGISSGEAVKEYVKTGDLSDKLRMRHTESNQSTSADPKSGGSQGINNSHTGGQINSSGKNDTQNEKLNDSFLLKENQSTKSVLNTSSRSSLRKLKVKTLRPNSDCLKALNLRLGANIITYTVQSTLQGKQTISASIYFWPHDANIIVSDVDGTITKTDLLGHVLPLFGKDWSQPGIAPLFTNLRKNGYYIVYLTSRPIGQARQTKEFLHSIYQDGKMLPHGPLVMSPDRMLPSVQREIIYKRPELFKMAALKDLKSLFPGDHNPFHAGFGNRETDAVAYRSVGIPLEKVFIVDSQGDIKHHNCKKAKSYALINTMIKDIFPGIIKGEKCKLAESLKETNVLKLDNQTDIEEDTMKVVS